MKAFINKVLFYGFVMSLIAAVCLLSSNAPEPKATVIINKPAKPIDVMSIMAVTAEEGANGIRVMHKKGYQVKSITDMPNNNRYSLFIVMEKY